MDRGGCICGVFVCHIEQKGVEFISTRLTRVKMIVPSQPRICKSQAQEKRISCKKSSSESAFLD
ncbi:hypothetical protein BDB00DRAFT_846290 [Zychaea mexicana]|uniref:uncharacterized protein n=1 Tax=Zychaea mexicana TaxID=64656 RepID=UPI0022FE50ED|nr:uncharacterized protein BDB00DRAFT_859869 [Zychaea mexicana]XP_052975086.1 uncharacterized protein BDB00DRAFT_846290 [Zychaea mexicana]KAI9476620.1 hypothetical protein BDB00DRAFT_859869 [Zychaea mexicana]KAI9488821.1 hypothetical protein BDB00DRAFT_846290 [Zychaea mexicana]